MSYLRRLDSVDFFTYGFTVDEVGAVVRLSLIKSPGSVPTCCK